MKKVKKEKNNIIIYILIALVVILLGVSVFLIIRNEDLNDRYEDLMENSYNPNYNNDDNTPSNDNPSTSNPTTPSDTSKTISREEALQKVLTNLKISRNDIRDLDIELEYKNRYQKTVYEISFDYNRYEYEYYIDPTTGNILDSFKTID